MLCNLHHEKCVIFYIFLWSHHNISINSYIHSKRSCSYRNRIAIHPNKRVSFIFVIIIVQTEVQTIYLCCMINTSIEMANIVHLFYMSLFTI